MKEQLTIGVIGDFNAKNRTHVATNTAIGHAADALGKQVAIEWVPTPQIAQERVAQLARFHGIWCSPGSPYVSMDGALAAIRFAREQSIPFFGT